MNIGVIGLGFMGAAHVAAIFESPTTNLAAVASHNTKAREGDLSEVGGNLNISQKHFDFSRVAKHETWQELVADANVEAVSICLPTHLHAKVTIAALEAGKHVLCEKPMALTSSECDSMLQAAKASGKTLMIAQVLRFWPEYRELYRFVKSGEYGRVRQATLVRKCGLPPWSQWLPDDSLSGGALMDLLVHDIDQMLHLFGMPRKVTGKRIGEADSVMASFLYPDGPEARLQGGWFEPGMPFSMSFQVRAEGGELSLQPDGLFLSDAQGARKKLEVGSANAYAAEIEYFAECCSKGVAPAECMPEESANAVRVALAIKESRAKDGEQIACLG